MKQCAGYLHFTVGNPHVTLSAIFSPILQTKRLRFKSLVILPKVSRETQDWNSCLFDFKLYVTFPGIKQVTEQKKKLKTAKSNEPTLAKGLG